MSTRAPAPGTDLHASRRRARTALGLPESPALLERRVAVVVEVDRSRALTCATQRTAWVALREATAFPVVRIEPTPVRERCRAEAVSSCRVGPSYVDLREGLFATRFELGARVGEGATLETVHRLRWEQDPRATGSPRPTPASSYELALPASFDGACLEVRFPPRRGPAAAEGFLRDGHHEEVVELRVEPASDGLLVRHRCAPRTGRAAHDGTVVVGVRWRW